MIKKIFVKNLSGFGRIKLNFCPGMNLFAGLNSVGKSRLLALIRILLSQTISNNKSLATELSFANLKIGKDKVNTKITCDLGDKPLVLFFSTNRSTFRLGSKRSEALELRDFNLVEFIEWWLGFNEQTGAEAATGQTKLAMVNEIVSSCLSWEGVFAASRIEKNLLIQKSSRVEYINQLSNAEKAVAAIVLELIRSLAQANPEIENPARDGKAIVLIDELDLHLHPKWQRSIVRQLTTAFPNCQFIGTTHSPQVISELQPEELTILLCQNNQVVAKSPIQAYGLDSNWILEHLMGVHARPEPAKELIDDIEDLLEEGDLSKARGKLAELKKMLHGIDGEAVRLEASIYSLEALTSD